MRIFVSILTFKKDILDFFSFFVMSNISNYWIDFGNLFHQKNATLSPSDKVYNKYYRNIMAENRTGKIRVIYPGEVAEGKLKLVTV